MIIVVEFLFAVVVVGIIRLLFFSLIWRTTVIIHCIFELHPPSSSPTMEPTRGWQKPARILGGDSIHLGVITVNWTSTEDQTCILQIGWLINALILSFHQI